MASIGSSFALGSGQTVDSLANAVEGLGERRGVGCPLPCPRGSLFWKPLARPESVYALLRLTAAWLCSWNCAGTLQMLDGTRRHEESPRLVTTLRLRKLSALRSCPRATVRPLGGLPKTFAAAQRIRPGSVAPAPTHDLANGPLPGRYRRQCMGPRDQRAPRASCTCATAAKPQARLEDGLRQSPCPRSTSRPLNLSRSWEIQGLLQPE